MQITGLGGRWGVLTDFLNTFLFFPKGLGNPGGKQHRGPIRGEPMFSSPTHLPPGLLGPLLCGWPKAMMDLPMLPAGSLWGAECLVQSQKEGDPESLSPAESSVGQ